MMLDMTQPDPVIHPAVNHPAVIHPSGQQFMISRGDQRAVLVEVGGGIRSYAVGGRDVLEPYPVEASCDGAHGAPLIPWPNRLEDGRYSFDGTSHQVALSEPSKHNASHGFLRWRSWDCIEQSSDAVAMGTTLHPMSGYPFTLQVRIDYRLTDEGLVVTTTATNRGTQDLPYAHGQHPYLSPGTGRIDDAQLQFGAGRRIETDPERQLPTGMVPVSGTPYDFGEDRPLGDLAIDHAFTDLSRDPDGRARLRLTGPDTRTAELWVDDAFPYLQLYTGDTLAPARRRTGLGSEPMTAPPNALASGIDVIRIKPGISVRTTWGARLC